MENTLGSSSGIVISAVVGKVGLMFRLLLIWYDDLSAVLSSANESNQ